MANFTGKWHVYISNDSEEEFNDTLSPSSFIKKVDAASLDNYLRIAEALDWSSGHDIVVQFVFNKVAKKSARNKNKKSNEEESQEMHIYNIVCSLEENLLLCNRIVPRSLNEIFSQALNCNELVLYDLYQCDAENAIKHVKQSRKSKLLIQAENGYLHDEYKRRGILHQPIQNEIKNKIGSDPGKYSKVKYIRLDAAKVPIVATGTTSSRKRHRLPKVTLELRTPSVYDLYYQYGEKNICQNVPNWVEKSITKGKNVLFASY